MLRHKTRGQSIVLGAALLFAFAALVVGIVVEPTYRRMQRSELEAALQQTARSAVQLLSYEQLAQNQTRLGAQACVNAPIASCWNATTASRLNTVLTENLSRVTGIQGTPAAIASQVRWTVHPQGGLCQFPGYPVVNTTPTSEPLVCITLRTELTTTGLLPVLGVSSSTTFRPLVVAMEAVRNR